jgi:hypothetical protein
MRTRRSGESALLLLDAVEVLGGERVDYAVVGAMAASVHRVVRASLDADAVLSITTHELGYGRQAVGELDELAGNP